MTPANPPPASPVKRGRLPLGWTIAGFLFILWFILQLWGWWYILRVHLLERRLEKVRPAISAIVLYKQIKESQQACVQAFEQIERLDLKGENLLSLLSEQIPPSVTIDKLEIHPLLGLQIRGSCMPGIRSPEAALARWVQSFQSAGYKVLLRDLRPDRDIPGLWRFDMKAEGL